MVPGRRGTSPAAFQERRAPLPAHVPPPPQQASDPKAAHTHGIPEGTRRGVAAAPGGSAPLLGPEVDAGSLRFRGAPFCTVYVERHNACTPRCKPALGPLPGWGVREAGPQIAALAHVEKLPGIGPRCPVASPSCLGRDANQFLGGVSPAAPMCFYGLPTANLLCRPLSEERRLFSSVPEGTGLSGQTPVHPAKPREAGVLSETPASPRQRLPAPARFLGSYPHTCCGRPSCLLTCLSLCRRGHPGRPGLTRSCVPEAQRSARDVVVLLECLLHSLRKRTKDAEGARSTLTEYRHLLSAGRTVIPPPGGLARVDAVDQSHQEARGDRPSRASSFRLWFGDTGMRRTVPQGSPISAGFIKNR